MYNAALMKVTRRNVVVVSASLLIAAISAICAAGGGTAPPGLHLMPVPESVVLNEGRLAIDGSFNVQLSGSRHPLVIRAATRMTERLQRKTGIPFSPEATRAVMEIHYGGEDKPAQQGTADESYKLEVTGETVRLSASSPTGIIRGLETFLQLVDLDKKSFFVPAVTIKDRPRFSWRGLLIDVSRHWQPVDVILRNLDAMAAVKMNVFHWHLSDDQGFRVESRKYPKLHEKGSDGKFYTHAQIRKIVAYAQDRGIRVIPEFDMPGHTTSWLVAYPELASAPGPYEIERAWGVFDPCMDPSRESVYEFLDGFIGEMAGLFPDPYFHIGGDEVNGKQWNASARIKAFKARNKMKSNRDLQAYFNRRLQKILEAHGKKMIGWNEILHPDLSRDVVVQSWLGQTSLLESARRGHSTVLSRGYYLDHMRPASFHYEIDPQGKNTSELSAEERARIIGGEACMWAEFVNPDNIESRIWPRAAAIAERLWSPAEINDVRDMYRRLEYINRDLDLLGLKHRDRHLEMIQRMAGDTSMVPLKRFADLVVPTNLAVRQKIRKYYSYTPLNRLVDAALPESDAVRHLDYLVENALKSSSGTAESAAQIRKILIGWQENESLLEATIDQSFLLEELKPLVATVAELNRRALEALQYLEARQKPGEAWQREVADLIARAEKPQAEMLPAIAAPVKKLIDAANGIP